MTIEQNDPGDLADLDDLGDLPAHPPAGLSEADFHGCRWIDGEPAPLRAEMFCGRSTRPGSSWCSEHYRIAFGRNARKRDAA